jgi:hypothetical protein
MSIGIRILSNNLSGQTTNVTYFPDTGGTIDWGFKCSHSTIYQVIIMVTTTVMFQHMVIYIH